MSKVAQLDGQGRLILGPRFEAPTAAKIQVTPEVNDATGVILDGRPSAVGSNERVGIKLGNYVLTQDVNADGTTDFGVADASGNSLAQLVHQMTGLYEKSAHVQLGAGDLVTAAATTGPTLVAGVTDYVIVPKEIIIRAYLNGMSPLAGGHITIGWNGVATADGNAWWGDWSEAMYGSDMLSFAAMGTWASATAGMAIDPASLSGLDLVLIDQAGVTLGWTGGIATSAVNAGGSGYAPGDTFECNDATGVVLTVDGGGAVLTYSITDPGFESLVANGVATSKLTGGGDDLFTIDIQTLDYTANPYTMDLWIKYYLVPAA